jgi:hypothetical protein
MKNGRKTGGFDVKRYNYRKKNFFLGGIGEDETIFIDRHCHFERLFIQWSNNLKDSRIFGGGLHPGCKGQSEGLAGGGRGHL